MHDQDPTAATGLIDVLLPRAEDGGISSLLAFKVLVSVVLMSKVVPVEHSGVLIPPKIRFRAGFKTRPR